MTTSRAAEFHGANDPDRLFPGGGLRAAVPWPAAGRRKSVKDYDKGLVNHVLTHPEEHQMVHVDPTDPNLRATQPEVTRAGVQHYMGSDYARTGQTFADQHNLENEHPVVYDREDGQRLLLSGHHRAAAALLQGKQFTARVVSGPWGESR
jgi:hypothetical protein